MNRNPNSIVVTKRGARFRGRELCCSVGRNGITTRKREGDGATPAGVFRLLGVLYRPDRIGVAGLAGAKPILGSDIWSDDPLDPEYNHLTHSIGIRRFSHERLRRPDGQYDLVVPIDHNWPCAVPNGGSAIFMHIWRKPRHPTAGCIAFSRDDLIWIVQRINERTRLIVRAF